MAGGARRRGRARYVRADGGASRHRRGRVPVRRAGGGVRAGGLGDGRGGVGGAGGVEGMGGVGGRARGRRPSRGPGRRPRGPLPVRRALALRALTTGGLTARGAAGGAIDVPGRDVGLGRARAAALRRLGEHLLGLPRARPCRRILAQEGLDDRSERGSGVPGLGRLLVHDGLHGGQRRGAPERRAALHRRVQRGAERPQVGGGPGVLAAHAFGGQVVDRADDLPGAGDRRVALHLGDAEVREQYPPVGGQQDVARLDVAVHDAGGVRGAQGAQHPQPDAGGLGRLQPLAVPDRVGERAALDQLHDDPRPVVVLQHVVHGDDGRVVDPRGRPCLGLGTRQQHRTVTVGDVERGRQFLDGDRPVEHLVPGTPYAAHAPAADRVDEPVAAREKLALHLIHVSPQWS